MARLMRAADESAAWGAESGSRSAARRNWASTAWLVAGTIAVAVTSYSLSLKVANERREMEKVARQNNALASELKALDAELRVRMRMPQLQRWNDNVLGLVPISAGQYLENPVRLTSYGKPLESEIAPAQLPQAQLAVRDVAPAQAVAPRPQLVSAEVAPAAPRPVAAIARPEEAAPADLLRQVEMTFGPSTGGQP
ncbi:hypothetical protein L6Q21_05750 [Sandaracinobacter sp. RS1-74]|uniref:hypothetical protein n=1 Tax=Sandaracinobacteroides sayramensis TaxID=2913411 RepID=UPI001EDA48FE|nr:hypothetical protein [Sandaracinobacteroides sayramensis]MCG2840481.1 hypothetical protein [Sandaracinobacteroides sayramensis]